MGKKKRAKGKVKKKAKTANLQKVEECISALRELHKLQGVLLMELDRCFAGMRKKTHCGAGKKNK